jgi:CheY-like chemotaxis protein
MKPILGPFLFELAGGSVRFRDAIANQENAIGSFPSMHWLGNCYQDARQRNVLSIRGHGCRPLRPIRDGGQIVKSLVILIADDWPDAAESLGAVLGFHGHKIHFARNGLEAMEKTRRINPDVVLLDVAMPRMTGLDVARILSEQDAHKPLLIALSGFCANGDKAKAYKAGFDHFFAKPTDASALLQILELRENSLLVAKRLV